MGNQMQNRFIFKHVTLPQEVKLLRTNSKGRFLIFWSADQGGHFYAVYNSQKMTGFERELFKRSS